MVWKKKRCAKRKRVSCRVIDMTDENCIFCKIIAGKIPSRKVYEDEEVFAFHDINPWAPVHFLIIPKLHIPSVAHATPEHEGLLVE